MARLPDPLFLPDNETPKLSEQFVSLGKEWLPQARAALLGDGNESGTEDSH